jgi:hypothetical protein
MRLCSALLLLVLAGCSQQLATQRFAPLKDDEEIYAFDSETGLVCATGFQTGVADKAVRSGATPVIDSKVFVPFCTDLYLNKSRAMRDFNDFLQQRVK